MKHKKLSWLLALQLGIVGSVAHANIVFQLGDGDICSKVTGNWTGQGTAKALSGLMTCIYTGSAVVTQGASPQNFDMNVSLHIKPEGSSKICPATESLTLPGTCENGVLAINTDLAKLQGQVTEDGTGLKADLSGQVSFQVSGRKVKANVKDMDLHKIS